MDIALWEDAMTARRDHDFPSPGGKPFIHEPLQVEIGRRRTGLLNNENGNQIGQHSYDGWNTHGACLLKFGFS
jgi:hypothetical protein